MIKLGIRDNVYMLLNRLGWVDLLRPMRGYENFTYEFLSSIVFTKDRMNRVYFRLMNIDYEMSLENFCNEMGFTNEGFIHDSCNHDCHTPNFDQILLFNHHFVCFLKLISFAFDPLLFAFLSAF